MNIVKGTGEDLFVTYLPNVKTRPGFTLNASRSTFLRSPIFAGGDLQAEGDFGIWEIKSILTDSGCSPVGRNRDQLRTRGGNSLPA